MSTQSNFPNNPGESLVMLVFKFIGKHYGLEALTKRRLKISRIRELNDPFELLSPNLSDPNVRFAFSNMKNDLDKKYGILCFSKSWNNPVMWSHYADRHQGICLGFRVPCYLLMRTIYVKQRTSSKRLVSGADLEREEKEMLKVLRTKFSHWQYEEEVRCFITLENIDSDRKFYFNSFSKDLVLEEVIVGSEAKISRKEIKDALQDDYERVTQFKARPAHKKFEVVQNRNSSLWK